jgi:hypothetical protein
MSIIDLNSSQDTTKVSCFKVANFEFDAQLSGSHEATKTVTANPIESGAKINDHSYLEPKQYTVTGMMTSYEPFDLVGAVVGSEIQFLKSLPIVSGLVSQTDGAVARVNLFASKVSRTVSTITSTARKFSKYIPSSTAQWLGDESDPTDRVQEAYSTLKSIMASEEPVTITTKLCNYDNMSLIGVQIAESSDDKAEFTLTFREILITETKVVNGLVVPATTKKTVGKATGRSENQSSDTKSKGKTSPVKQENKSNRTSALRSIGDLIKKGSS